LKNKISRNIQSKKAGHMSPLFTFKMMKYVEKNNSIESCAQSMEKC